MSGPAFTIRGLIPFYPSRDLAAAADFYVRELSLEAVREDPRRVVFRASEGALLGFYLHDEPLPQHGALVLSFVTDDVDAVYKSLRHHGVETEARPKEREGRYSFFAWDPDGYRVEVGRG